MPKRGPTSSQLKAAITGLTRELKKLKGRNRTAREAITGHLHVIASYCRGVFPRDRDW